MLVALVALAQRTDDDLSVAQKHNVKPWSVQASRSGLKRQLAADAPLVSKQPVLALAAAG